MANLEKRFAKTIRKVLKMFGLQTLMAEREGFEPSVPRKRENCFRDCRWLAFRARGLTMSAISDVIAANILVVSFL
jgi:hypothetical protein